MSASKPVGIVFVDLAHVRSKKLVDLVLRKAMPYVPPGRSLVVVWKTVDVWRKEFPFESVVSDFVLRTAKEREFNEWVFFGNGITRSYKAGAKSPDCSWNWLIFRRLGDKAYVRRKDSKKHTIRENTLSTLDKVFTRDIANNVWHLPSSRAQKRTLDRLQSLLSWTDETGLIVSRNGVKRRSATKQNYSDDLIGKAIKTPYQYID
jgi:hypothetical protein